MVESKDRKVVLFVTWDGPQVNYLESLFIPIFSRLSELGFDFHILQFTWGDAARIATTRKLCLDCGLTYKSVQVWRRPISSGSFFSAVVGGSKVLRMIRNNNIDIVMPRSTLPALAVLLASQIKARPIVFDSDGLPIDERIEFGGLKEGGVIVRLLRSIEARAIRVATVVMTRSEKAVDILLRRTDPSLHRQKFLIVRNGRDSDLFSPGDSILRARTREKLGVEETSPLVVYVGSLGPKYCLFEMLRLFSFVRSKSAGARLLVLTPSPELVKRVLSAHKHLGDSVTTMWVRADEVPSYLGAADLGLALIRPHFSMQGVAPVKLGEYLLCGLPVVATDGIGDTESIITPEVGFMTRKMDDAELERAADWFLGTVIPDREGFRSRCRGAGLRDFSLEAAVEDYRHALELATRQLVP